MSLRDLEAAILRELREVTGMKKLRQKDIAQWSTGAVRTGDGELTTFLPTLGVHVAYKSPPKKREVTP
jgi:hypothetical protein